MSNNTLFEKLRATADIIGGTVFFATELGVDPEYPERNDLLANGMYIRLEGSDGSLAYISAFEIDKAIGIIGEMSMSKANAADLDSLRAEVEEKASTVDLELLQTELSNTIDQSLDVISESIKDKADKSIVDNLIEVLNNKVDKTEVNAISDELDAKADQEYVETLSNTISNKADNATVDALRRDIQNLQSALETMTDISSINAINTQIAYLNSEIQKRLTVDDLVDVNQNIFDLNVAKDSLTEKVEIININLNKKASTTYVQNQINELNHAITSLATKVDNKAEKSGLDLKANKADVDKLVKNVKTLNTTVQDALNELENQYNDIHSELENSVSQDELDTAVNALSESVSKKVDKADFDRHVITSNSKLVNIETKHTEDFNELDNAIKDLDCEVDNRFNEVDANLSSHSRQLSNQATQISKLQAIDDKYAEQLKTQWVRVLTPEEYKRLAPVGDKFSDGTPNPYAKQPNIVYMLVRYNKPIAVYIGEILIAQAEQKGSVGFAYTFPISF